MNHILRICPRASEVWEALKFRKNLSCSLNVWLRRNLTASDLSSFAQVPSNVIFCFALWFIWIRRNITLGPWLFKKENIKSCVLIKKICWAATEWFYSQSHPIVGKAPNTIVHPPSLSWSPPQPLFLKINTDASFLFSSKEACLAAICRDDSGSWIEGIHSITFAHDAAEAELKAIFMALKWIKNKGWSKLILVTDCLTAWKEIILPSNVTNNLSSLSNDCRELSLELHDVTILHEGRGSNALADAVAKEAKGRRDGYNTICILSNYPPACMSIYVSEKNNILWNPRVAVQESMSPQTLYASVSN